VGVGSQMSLRRDKAEASTGKRENITRPKTRRRGEPVTFSHSNPTNAYKRKVLQTRKVYRRITLRRPKKIPDGGAARILRKKKRSSGKGRKRS